MNITINQQRLALPDDATLAFALATLAARPPFAVAVNRQFVPATRHAETRLAEGDEVEVIQPVTGG
jgi:sulfur carrier protein